MQVFGICCQRNPKQVKMKLKLCLQKLKLLTTRTTQTNVTAVRNVKLQEYLEIGIIVVGVFSKNLLLVDLYL